jgi:hypothetical protein
VPQTPSKPASPPPPRTRTLEERVKSLEGDLGSLSDDVGDLEKKIGGTPQQQSLDLKPDPLIEKLKDLEGVAAGQGSSLAEILAVAAKALLGLNLMEP